MEEGIISSVQIDHDATMIIVRGLPNRPGSACQLFRLMSDEDINIDIIVQTTNTIKYRDISITINDEADAQRALELLNENREDLGIESAEIYPNKAKLTIVGAGMLLHAGIAARIFECLYNTGAKIDLITTSEVRISVVMEKEFVRSSKDAVINEFRLQRQD